MPVEVYILVGLALVFTFLNGIHDSSNIVATIIFSRAMAPRLALVITAIAEFIGPFVLGVAIAKTIAEDIVTPSAINIVALIAAVASAILWSLLTWYFGIPSSSSHALIGGLIGAVVAGAGFDQLHGRGIMIVFLALFLSPLLGMLIGFLFTKLVYFLARNATPRINWFFKRAQILTGMALALSHGANDAQKAMGIITLGLVTTGMISDFSIPSWVVIASAAGIALGTGTGGWRMIRTMGGKFYKIRPVHGFSTQVSSAIVIVSAALVGGPVSTTQVVSSAILGVGTADRVNKVRWIEAGNIILAWVLTIPITAGLAYGLYYLVSLVF